MPDAGPLATHQRVGLVLGPVLAAVVLVVPAPAGLSQAAWRTAAIGLWMAVWWATEAVPVAATALMPIAAFPLAGISGISGTTAPYASPTIFLFLGGFLIALAVQRWELHRRIALSVVAASGGSGASVVGGFMAASALVSMWVTNTATTMMLLPIAASVVTVVVEHVSDRDEAERHFPVAMMLGVAYGATIGGVATLVGTPPNALLAAYMDEAYGRRIGFAEWMLVGVPVSVLLLPACWWLLTRWLHPVRFSTGGATREHIRELRESLGRMTAPERRVAFVFAALVAAWVSRPLLERLPGLGGVTDAGIAMLAGLALFVVPSGSRRSAFLMRWKDTRELPWGVLLLFGGGLSLAAAVSDTGLAAWLGHSLTALGTARLAVLVVVIAAVVIFLTELTSNTATAATFLPVAAAVAAEAGYAPISLTAPVALAASCAFMLPVATPPNAVVYASGMLTIPQMARAGFLMNLLGIGAVWLAAVVLAPLVLG